MAKKYKDEYKIAIRDISQYALHRLDPFDRVKTAEWVRRISGLSQEQLECLHRRNNYAQLLRLMVKAGKLHGPFASPPPEGDLPPLEELLGRYMSTEIVGLARVGPLAPVLSQRSACGTVHVAVKPIPAGGVFCYMACSPDGLSYP